MVTDFLVQCIMELADEVKRCKLYQQKSGLVKSHSSVSSHVSVTPLHPALC